MVKFRNFFQRGRHNSFNELSNFKFSLKIKPDAKFLSDKGKSIWSINNYINNKSLSVK